VNTVPNKIKDDLTGLVVNFVFEKWKTTILFLRISRFDGFYDELY
jgi:hypothetical protein